MEKAAVGAGADLIDDVGLEIAVDGARDVLAVACRCCQRRVSFSVPSMRLTGLGEEGGEALVAVVGLALLSEVSIGLYSWSAMFPMRLKLM